MRAGLFSVATAMCFLALALPYAHAQTPAVSIHFSYQAQSFAPWTYRARVHAPAVAGVPVRINALLWTETQNEGMRILPPATYTFRWFYNDRLVQEGQGSYALTLAIPPRAINTQEIALRVLDNRGNTVAFGTLSIPLANPQLALFRVYENGATSLVSQTSFPMKTGEKLSLLAQPYFFAVEAINQIAFAWTADGAAPRGEPQSPYLFTITAPSVAPAGTESSFTVTASNFANASERIATTFSTVIVE